MTPVVIEDCKKSWPVLGDRARGRASCMQVLREGRRHVSLILCTAHWRTPPTGQTLPTACAVTETPPGFHVFSPSRTGHENLHVHTYAIYVELVRKRGTSPQRADRSGLERGGVAKTHDNVHVDQGTHTRAAKVEWLTPLTLTCGSCILPAVHEPRSTEEDPYCKPARGITSAFRRPSVVEG